MHVGQTTLVWLFMEYFLNADESATTRYVTQIKHKTEPGRLGVVEVLFGTAISTSGR